MKKTIKIGDKEYLMQSSAFTSFKYRDMTNRTLIKDLGELGKKYNEVEIDKDNALDTYGELDEFIITALRIAYIMTCEANSYSGTFEDYLKGIDNYLEDVNWISEVVELAISPLSRNVQAIQDK